MDKATNDKFKLGKIWFESGVDAAKTHWPDTIPESWEDISDSDKQFMQATAENFIQKLEVLKNG